MDFEEWWATLETREQHRADKALTEEAFTAGAASRDAEVAGLVAALERCREYMELSAQNRTVQPYVEVCEALAKVRKP